MLRIAMAIIVILDLICFSSLASAAEIQGLVIISGQMGRPDGAHWMDISARLQSICGAQSPSCDIWCARETFGGHNLGRHGICRAIYRCPDGSTRSTEAARDEPILMRCPDDDVDDRHATAAGGN